MVYAGAAARGPRARVDAFTGALLTEIELRADALDAAFGGRTAPARHPLHRRRDADAAAGVVDRRARSRSCRQRFGLADDAEVTIEANPGPDERGDARSLVEAGINRLSMGAQSFDAGLLRRLGRRHGPADVAAAVAAAREAGIASISLDLLYDVPGPDRGEPGPPRSTPPWRSSRTTSPPMP